MLKKWSSVLDAGTRPTHRILDGRIWEPDELQKRAEYFGLDKSDEFEDFKKKYLGIPSANGSNKSARNGKTIQFDWKGTDARHANQQQIIKSLSDEYNTRLQKVTIGAKQAAGDVDITGSRMRLSDAKTHTAIHEFAHTLANSTADKLGLTSDSGFWKEIRSIRNAYHRDVDKTQNVSRWISHYEHSNKSVDEFLAEAFTQAKMHELGLELPETYGSDLTYSKKVLEVVDKYFKKEPLVNIRKSGIVKNIDVDDIADQLYGTQVSEEVSKFLKETIKKQEAENGVVFNYVSKKIEETGEKGTHVLQTVPVSFGKGRVLTMLNINTDALGGKTIEEIDRLFAETKKTAANTFEEAIVHECGHNKLIQGLTNSQIEDLYNYLEPLGRPGISEVADIDGVEAIADLHVKIKRGDIISKEDQAFYDMFMKGQEQ